MAMNMRNSTRFLSTLFSRNHYHHRNIHTNSWKLPVSPGGTLKARFPTTCHLTIYPLDPITHDWSYAKVDMHVTAETSDVVLSESCAARVATSFNARVISDTEPGRNFLQIEAPPETGSTFVARGVHRLRSWLTVPFSSSSSSITKDEKDKIKQEEKENQTEHNDDEEEGLYESQVSMYVGIPGKFDLDIELESGSVTISDTFEGDVKIHTDTAHVSANKLKSMYIDVEVTDHADVTMNVLQGNLSLRCMSGLVDIGRIQGPSVRLVSDIGDMQIRSLYADYSMLRSREGTVRIGGAQGYTKIRTTEGNVEVAGVDGRLDIETDCGDIEANLSVPKTVSVRSKRGDIAVGLPDNMQGNVLFEGGNSMDIDRAIPFIPTLDENDTNNSKKEKLEDYNNNYDNDEMETSSIVKGEIVARKVEKSDFIGNNDDIASVHARAPGGDLSVSRQSWGATLYGNGTRKSFPRWVESTS